MLASYLLVDKQFSRLCKCNCARPCKLPETRKLAQLEALKTHEDKVILRILFLCFINKIVVGWFKYRDVSRGFILALHYKLSEKRFTR